MVLTTISRLGIDMKSPTQRSLDKARRLLAHLATFPNATLVFLPSDMILKIICDAAYNSERLARSRAGVFYYLGYSDNYEFINGPIECNSTVIPTVVSSAGRAEYAA